MTPFEKKSLKITLRQIKIPWIILQFIYNSGYFQSASIRYILFYKNFLCYFLSTTFQNKFWWRSLLFKKYVDKWIRLLGSICHSGRKYWKQIPSQHPVKEYSLTPWRIFSPCESGFAYDFFFLSLKVYTANFSPIKSTGDPRVAKHTL